MRVSVMTFNIQHGVDYKRRRREEALRRAERERLKDQTSGTKAPPAAEKEDPSLIDLSLAAKVIRACGAEIVCLNEVRDTAPGVSDPCFTPQVREIAERLGFGYFYFGRAIDIAGKGTYGNGLISRYPILEAETIPVPDPAVKDEPAYYESRCVIRAVIDVAGRPLTVLATHMGLAMGEAKNAVRTVLSLVRPGEAAVLMGDFNQLPDSPILEPLRSVFTDAAERLGPGEMYSFPSDEPDRKIDYIMTAGPAEIVKASIPAFVASDHRPHTAILELG